MNGFENIGIKEYFKRYGVKYGLVRGVYLAFPFHFVRDYSSKKILYYRLVHKYLSKRYPAWRKAERGVIRYGNANLINPIWVYWKQGLSEAPDIVKLCVESVKNYYKSSLIVLSDQNLSEYIVLPQDIVDGVTRGRISIAAYSDILRFSLLEHYGGTWVDGTVFLTDKLPDYVTNTDLFAFRDSLGTIYNPALMSVWLIHCKPHNTIIRETRNMLLEYWSNNKTTMEYLLSYIAFTVSLENHRDVFERIPFINSEYSYQLLENLSCTYDMNKETHINSMTSVHKLTYKLEGKVYDDKNNFYNHIMSYLK